MTAPTVVPTLELPAGVLIPQIGFGLFKVDPGQAQRVTEQALEAGYRHLDTATVYGNEKEVGRAIRACGLSRDDLFITTKVWNSDQGTTATRGAFERSRDAIGLEVLDLYLIHWPVPMQGLYAQTWMVLEELLAEDAVRAIGVSNFLVEQLDRLAELGLTRPAVNQIEVHPTNQERALIAECHRRGIAIEAYSPLARGAAVRLEAVEAIAAHHGRTVAQVILRWHLQHRRIVLPKTVTPTRMRENLDVLDFALTADECATLDALESGQRIGADPLTFTGS